MPIRVRAVIIQDNRILTIKRTKPEELFWCCPGGEVEVGESKEIALKREIKEELGVEIKILKLLTELASQKPETKGQLEYFYLCEIVGGDLGSGTGPEYQKDSGYVGRYELEWLSIIDLPDFDFRPRQVGEMLISML